MSRIRLTIMVGVVAAGTLFACYMLFFHGRPADLSGDAGRWDELARSVANGTGLTPPHQPYIVDREPFYAVFAGVVYWFFGARPAYVLLAQSAVLIFALMFLAWGLVPILGAPAAALVPLATIATPGVAALATGSLLAEPFALSLLITSFAIFVRGILRRGKGHNLFFAGLFLGMVAITRYIYFLLPFLLLAGLFVLKSKRRLDPDAEISWRVSACLLAGFFIPVGIWIAYVSAALGSFAPFGTKGGAELLITARRAELSGKGLFAFATGSLFGDVTGRYIFPYYAKEVEPYSMNNQVLKNFSVEYVRPGQAAAVNSNAEWHAISFIFTHPFRFLVIAVSELFFRNSPMLWNNAADMRHLFAETHLGLPEWFRVASVALYRLAFIGMVLFALYAAVKVLMLPHIPPHLYIPAVTVLAINIAHSFFDSVPRHALPLYPLYFLLVVAGLQKILRRGDAAQTAT